MPFVGDTFDMPSGKTHTREQVSANAELGRVNVFRQAKHSLRE